MSTFHVILKLASPTSLHEEILWFFVLFLPFLMLYPPISLLTSLVILCSLELIDSSLFAILDIGIYHRLDYTLFSLCYLFWRYWRTPKYASCSDFSVDFELHVCLSELFCLYTLYIVLTKKFTKELLFLYGNNHFKAKHNYSFTFPSLSKHNSFHCVARTRDRNRAPFLYSAFPQYLTRFVNGIYFEPEVTLFTTCITKWV